MTSKFCFEWPKHVVVTLRPTFTIIQMFQYFPMNLSFSFLINAACAEEYCHRAKLYFELVSLVFLSIGQFHFIKQLLVVCSINCTPFVASNMFLQSLKNRCKSFPSRKTGFGVPMKLVLLVFANSCLSAWTLRCNDAATFHHK